MEAISIFVTPPTPIKEGVFLFDEPLGPKGQLTVPVITSQWLFLTYVVRKRNILRAKGIDPLTFCNMQPLKSD
jgi:hypothetical protein